MSSTSHGRLLGGRYRLGQPLGRGGMSVVWRAIDEMLGREVAVKTLDLTGPDSDSAAQRFDREARATARLNHPNIVTVYDTGVEDDTAYLVMELLPGPTLAEQVRDDGPLPVADVRAIGIDVASALSAAHAAGIVHRDIKPGNISYAADGTVKVLDFGITQLLDETLGQHHQLTMTNTVVGTAEYLAPEQAAGGRVDARADLYALGCVLTTLLTGSAPFTGPTPVSIMMQAATEVPPDVRDARPDTPADIAELINGLLAKDPAARPQTAAEVEQLLRSHQAPPTQIVAPPPLPPVAPTQLAAAPPDDEPKRSKAWLWWLLLGLVIAALVIFFLWNRSGDDSPSPSPSVTSSAPSPTESSSTPAPTVTESRTQTVTPTPTPEPTEPSPEPTSPPPDDEAPQGGEAVSTAAEDMSSVVDDLRQSDDIRPEAAQRIQNLIEQIGQNVSDENPERVRDNVTEIEGIVAGPDLSPEGERRIAEPMTNLRQAADAYGE